MHHDGPALAPREMDRRDSGESRGRNSAKPVDLLRAVSRACDEQSVQRRDERREGVSVSWLWVECRSVSATARSCLVQMGERRKRSIDGSVLGRRSIQRCPEGGFQWASNPARDCSHQRSRRTRAAVRGSRSKRSLERSSNLMGSARASRAAPAPSMKRRWRTSPRTESVSYSCRPFVLSESLCVPAVVAAGTVLVESMTRQ